MNANGREMGRGRRVRGYELSAIWEGKERKRFYDLRSAFDNLRSFCSEDIREDDEVISLCEWDDLVSS